MSWTNILIRDSVKKNKNKIEVLHHSCATFLVCLTVLYNDYKSLRAEMPGCGHAVTPMSLTDWCRRLLDEVPCLRLHDETFKETKHTIIPLEKMIVLNSLLDFITTVYLNRSNISRFISSCLSVIIKLYECFIYKLYLNELQLMFLTLTIKLLHDFFMSHFMAVSLQLHYWTINLPCINDCYDKVFAMFMLLFCTF